MASAPEPDLLDPLRDWPEGTSGGCLFETLRGVRPLDSQFGVHPLRTVPEALSERLFATGAQAYAVLDGAMIPDLGDILTTSGLRHDCLFRGQARADWGAAAPWLVALAPENALVRALFTQTPEALPWHYWARGPGVYLSVAAPFEEVMTHLRRFTRLRDPQGNWFYFRFWERQVLPALAAEQEGLAEALVAEIGGAQAVWLIPEPAAAAVLSARRAPERLGQVAQRPALGADALAALDRATQARHQREEIAGGLAALSEPEAAAYRTDPRLFDLWSRLAAQGFRQPEQRREAIGLYLKAAGRQDHARAWKLLTDPGPGPKNRLWHLRRSLEEQGT